MAFLSLLQLFSRLLPRRVGHPPTTYPTPHHHDIPGWVVQATSVLDRIPGSRSLLLEKSHLAPRSLPI